MPRPRWIGLAIVATGVAIAALIPVFLVLYPAAGLGPDDARNPLTLLPVIARNPALFVVPGMLELVGHVIGAVAVIGIWFRWGRDSFWLTCTTLAGVAWMTVDALDNAFAIQVVPQIAAAHVAGDPSAASTFGVVAPAIDAIRLAGHVAGGLWVIGIGAVLMRARLLHPIIGWLGIAVGAILAANPLVPALLNVSFMTLPAWLIVLGIAIARGERFAPIPQPTPGTRSTGVASA